MKKLISILMVILMIITSVPMFAFADVGDNDFTERESNDSFSTADRIYNDYTVSGALSRQYDIDHFKFTLSATSDVEVLCLSEKSPLLVGIWDEDDECVAGGYSYYDEYYYDLIEATLPAGTYYIVLFQDTDYSYSNIPYLFYFEYATAASSHTHSFTAAVTAPTCTEQGYTTYTCSCGESYDSNYTTALGHNLTNWANVSANKQERHCTRCDYSEEQTVQPSEHQWGEWVVTVAPTCETKGERKRTCSTCGETETEVTEASHVAVEVSGRAPTCTEEGYTGGSSCSVCGKVLSEAGTLPTIPHNEIKEIIEKGSPDKDGSYKIYCDMCGEVFEEDCFYKPEWYSFGDVYIDGVATYTGKAITPEVTVGATDYDFEEGVDYDVVYPDEIKEPGRYTITVNFKGNYEGSKEVYFDVVPAAPKTFEASTVTSSSISLKWSASTGATGYRVYQYSPSKDEYVKKASQSKTTYKRTGLKGNTSYTFMVQPYTKLADGTVLWGETKTVTAKTKSAYSVTISGSSATLYVGATKQLKATTTPSGKKLTWKSSDKTIAKVSSSGKVTAVKKGTATITAYFKVDGKTYKDTYKITVKTPTISLNKTSASLAKGKTLTLKATTAPSDVTVKWSSSNTSVATVSSSGKVTAKKAGSATITASFSYKGTTYKKTCKITVTNASSSSAQDNITSLIKYIKSNGSTNKNGNKFIKKTSTSGDYTFTYAIVYDSSTDKLNFIGSSEYKYYGGINSTYSMELNRKGTSADFETIYLFDNSYGDTVYAAHAIYTMKPSSYYDEYDVFDYWEVNTFPDSADIDSLVFDGLDVAMGIWDGMVKSAIGVGLKGIGFTHYS